MNVIKKIKKKYYYKYLNKWKEIKKNIYIIY